MGVKLLTEYHLELLSLKGGCIGPSESTLVKMPHCWKSHVTAHLLCISTVCMNGKISQNRSLINVNETCQLCFRDLLETQTFEFSKPTIPFLLSLAGHNKGSDQTEPFCQCYKAESIFAALKILHFSFI